MNLAQRFLALLCRICPFCIAARRWPDSAYARTLTRLERDCPACRAYARLKGPK
jgi:hypothetical protein